MATVLSIIQDITKEFNSIATPSSIVTSGDNTVKQFKAIFEKEGRRLSRYCNWPRLRKEYTFTLTASDADYSLPSDFDRFISDTTWDRGNNWKMIGALTPQEWQIEQSGVIASGPRRKFTIKGWADDQFFITPTPGSGDAGSEQVFEYMSCTWLRPATWAAATAYSPGAYVSYNGNIYTTTNGGTSGATAPTHTSGDASDDNVTWSYYAGSYDSIISDADVPLLDADLLALGTIWRFMRQNGLPNFEDIRAEYQYELSKRASAYVNARTLNMASGGASRLISSANFPDTIS